MGKKSKIDRIYLDELVQYTPKHLEDLSTDTKELIESDSNYQERLLRLIGGKKIKIIVNKKEKKFYHPKKYDDAVKFIIDYCSIPFDPFL